MIGIFAAIVLVAIIFFWVKPQNLLFGKEELASPPLDPSALNDAIEDIIVANVKSDCLKNPSP